MDSSPSFHCGPACCTAFSARPRSAVLPSIAVFRELLDLVGKHIQAGKPVSIR